MSLTLGFSCCDLRTPAQLVSAGGRGRGVGGAGGVVVGNVGTERVGPERDRDRERGCERGSVCVKHNG